VCGKVAVDLRSKLQTKKAVETKKKRGTKGRYGKVYKGGE
jgi:hypothetical protein